MKSTGETPPLADDLVGVVEQMLAERPRWPGATYRLQFSRDQLSFRAAADLIPYLARLGVSHIYSSPVTKARSGSGHGYDVVDPSRLNPELGTEEDYSALVAAIHGQRLGQVLDIVPNHMGIAPVENPYWTDVLENGPSSPYAGYFDISWHPVKPELDNKVLLPLLEDQYGKVLEAQNLQVAYRNGEFFLQYHEQRLPLEPRSYAQVLSYRLDELKAALGPESAELRELESVLTALDYMPRYDETHRERTTERQREKEVVKGRIRQLVSGSTAIADFIERNVREFNGTADDPASFDRLDRLLNAQVYRLSYWKAASDEINYRRFFDISELAAVCTEDPPVFDATHRLIFELLARGAVDGLRIDHIDGLYDPLDYLQRLQQGYVRALGRAAFEKLQAERIGTESRRDPLQDGTPASPAPSWDAIEPQSLAEIRQAAEADQPLPLYTVVEKILGPQEPLPPEWPCAGTTGYDALNQLNRLLVDPAGFPELTKIYQRFIGERLDFPEVAYRSKLLILRMAMSSELQLLAHQLNRLSERHRRCRDFTLNTLRLALREILACFPVYRTYIRHGEISEQDRQIILRATAQAKRRLPAMDPAALDFIRDVLVFEQPPHLDVAGRVERELFVGRFQQTTSPLVAKGIEDTAFYIYFPLASLNEVGGDPNKPTLTLDEFHRENLERAARQPGALVSTTTHDTKRSEDVRARLAVLSEVPHVWKTAVNHWARLNRRHRRDVDGLPAPSRDDEYLFYQTLIGTWPLEPPNHRQREAYLARIQQYMEKAIHEAKVRTSWINPNAEYETAMREFVAAALADQPRNRFLAELRAFVERILNWGLYNAFSQTLWKLTVPGVPDIYQGQELWDFSLVDPDNRRPVDFARRSELLAAVEAEVAKGAEPLLQLAGELARDPRDPRAKLFVTWRLLQFRQRHADLFRHGEYLPVTATGSRASHLCAFARRLPAAAGRPEQTAIIVAPRLPARLAAASELGADYTRPLLGPAFWADTQLSLGELPPQRLVDLFTGRILSGGLSNLAVADVLAQFPIALLTSVGESDGPAHQA